MTVVCDASVAVESAMDGPGSKETENTLADFDTIIAPDLYVSEITNAFWKHHRIKGVDVASCENGIRQCLAIPDTLVDSRYLVKAAFYIACTSRHSSYDCFYLACAQEYQATLLTMDKKLARVAKKLNIETRLMTLNNARHGVKPVPRMW